MIGTKRAFFGDEGPARLSDRLGLGRIAA